MAVPDPDARRAHVPAPTGARALRRLHEAVAAGTVDVDLAVVLRRLVEAAVGLLDARYGALGVVAADRATLRDFVTVGVEPPTMDGGGGHPVGHEMHALVIRDACPLRLPDLVAYPGSSGFPRGLLSMTSFLGVPVFVGSEAFGSLYVTGKRRGAVFTEADEALAVALSLTAGLAIERAQGRARGAETVILEDRDRIARDLHDKVIQRLFATGLSLESAGMLARPIPELACRIRRAVDDLDATIRDIRHTIFALHEVTTAAATLRRQLADVVEQLADALGFVPELRFEGVVDTQIPPLLASEIVMVVGEGLVNVARHANASTASITVSVRDGRLVARVDDDGVFPGRLCTGGSGLANLRTRAMRQGGRCDLVARPGGGTRLLWQVPLPR
ncbi:MAG: putative signal transduction histidine kinase [Acidimicrobiales bacterium]|nr:putative signal transduction histidine kinase [Acidimicrobiales bacterium]